MNKKTLIYGTPISCNPLITIAIPTYKRYELLKEAIDSVICQKGCSPYEIIVLDNDQSPYILDLMKEYDPSKIVVYQNEINLGMWGNMNSVPNIAKGDWILILHDDDLLKPDALHRFEELLSKHKNKSMGCITGGVELLYERKRKPLMFNSASSLRFMVFRPQLPQNELVLIDETQLIKDVPKFCSTFYRKEYIRGLGGWDADCCGYADLAMFLKIIMDGNLFFSNQVFGIFRVHDDNESNPDYFLKSYPLESAQRLLSHYVNKNTNVGNTVYTWVEKDYFDYLWKRCNNNEERKGIAMRFEKAICARSFWYRLFLKNNWLINILANIYKEIRPLLSQHTN